MPQQLESPSAVEHVPASDAALLLGMSTGRLVRLIQSGAIRGARIFGRWVVERESLDARISGRTRIAPSSPNEDP